MPPVPTSMPRNIGGTSEGRCYVVGKCICLEMRVMPVFPGAINGASKAPHKTQDEVEVGGGSGEASLIFALFCSARASNTYSQTATDERVASEPPDGGITIETMSSEITTQRIRAISVGVGLCGLLLL